MTADDITIAITFFSHKRYVKQAVASALNQTIPVRVMVVENCAPDPEHGAEVKAEFGSRIRYVRNPVSRGGIGNWNACLELCQTEWISILHDDDFLAPNFVEEILKLAAQAPGMDLYFGQTTIVNEQGDRTALQTNCPVPGPWMKIGLTEVIYGPRFSFPGQLFRVASARAAGGFRVHSHYCAEWEMWAKLIAHAGAAQTSVSLGFFREHGGWERISSRAYRLGKNIPATIVQHRRVLALMPERPKFDRADYQRRNLIPIRYLLRYGAHLSPRLLRYHIRLLWLSPAPNWPYAIFKLAARLGGCRFVRLASWFWNKRSASLPSRST